MFRVLDFPLAISVLAMSASAITAPPYQAILGDLRNVGFPASNRVAAGALLPGDIAALQKAGVREVINLRAPEETHGFHEAEAMGSAGINYHSLPIRGTTDLTRDNAVQFDRLLTGAGNRLALVHCASSNRVGAMVALRAAVIDGLPTEAALAEGRRWGLTSLEPAVCERLDAWSFHPTPAPASSS